jgi:hypothetical protein
VAVRLSEFRARLLGLDAPVVTKIELTARCASRGETRRERELFDKLDVQQLKRTNSDACWGLAIASRWRG